MYYVWSRLKQMKGEKLLWLMLWKKRKCSIYHQCGRMKEGTSSLCCSFRPCRVVFVPTCMFIHRRSVSLASVCLLHSLSLFSCLFCLIQWLLLWGFVLNSIKGVISSSKVGTGGFLFQAGDCRSYKSHRGTETGGGGVCREIFCGCSQIPSCSSTMPQRLVGGRKDAPKRLLRVGADSVCAPEQMKSVDDWSRFRLCAHMPKTCIV